MSLTVSTIRKRSRLVLLWVALGVIAALPHTGVAQSTTGRIVGTVADAQNGEALPGANVVVAGTSIGAATLVDGTYTIPFAPAGPQILVVSYVGYVTDSLQVEVVAGETIEVDAVLGYQTLNGVTVTAQVAGQLGAINEQFNDATVKNVVSRARIQELPDNNAAESIGRLPGVAIQRSGGEANKVAIRGLSPELNNVTVNGVRLPSTDGSDRSVDLSLVSSNILEGIEVRKAITPDMDADVIGGAIDLRLKSAPVGFEADVLAQGGYTSLQDDYGNYKFVATASDRLFNDRLGVIGTVNTDRYDRSADKLGVGYIDQDVTTDSTSVEIPTIRDLDLREETVTRSRVGGSILLDYRLPGGRLTANTFYNRLNDDALFRNYRPTDDGVSFNVEDRERATSLLTMSIGAEQALPWLEYDANLSYTQSRIDTPESLIWDFQQVGNAFENNLAGRVGLDPQGAFGTVTADSTAPLANVWVDATDLRDNQVTAELNLLRQYRIGPHLSGFVKAGTKLRWLDRTFDAERNGQQGIQFPGFWNSVAETCLADALGPEWDEALDLARAQSFLPISVFARDYGREDDFINGDYGLGIVPDVEMLTEFTRALQSEGCSSEYLRNSIGSIGQDYEGSERYRAGYLMARIDIGRYVTLIPGIRYEGERTEYTGQRFREIINALREGPPADLEELVVEREHDFWLPMVHLDIRPVDWLSVRLARTETISRPGFNQYAPITSIDGFGTAIQAANADLRPSEATNYDASVQVINDKLGLLGVSAFRKQIDGLVFPVRFPARLVVADGDSTLLGVPDGTNVPSAWLEGTTPDLFSFVNNESETTYWGVEFEWQTNFSYLPGALKGLVLNLNYTRSFSEAFYKVNILEQTFIPGSRPPRFDLSISDTTRTGRMPDQAAHVFNATIGYDFRGFSARLSYLFQSNTTSAIEPRETLLDTFVGDYARFDLSLRQKVRSGFEVFANLNNLNNREDRSFTGQVDGTSFSETYPSFRELYGLTADIGLRFRY